jgi:hypothetical protein
MRIELERTRTIETSSATLSLAKPSGLSRAGHPTQRVRLDAEDTCTTRRRWDSAASPRAMSIAWDAGVVVGRSAA